MMDIETLRLRYSVLEHECGHSLQKLLFARPGSERVGEEDVATLARHLATNYRQFSALASELLHTLETLESRPSQDLSYPQPTSTWAEASTRAFN